MDEEIYRSNMMKLIYGANCLGAIFDTIIHWMVTDDEHKESIPSSLRISEKMKIGDKFFVSRKSGESTRNKFASLVHLTHELLDAASTGTGEIENLEQKVQDLKVAYTTLAELVIELGYEGIKIEALQRFIK